MKDIDDLVRRNMLPGTVPEFDRTNLENYLSNADFEEKFGLTPEQEKAVKSLERAFKRCYKEGILLFNKYGDLIAYNKEYVKCVDDEPEGPLIDGDIGRKVNSGVNLDSWADDRHFVHLHDHVKSELSRQKQGDEDEPHR
ncbi:MAG: hypothetical protein PHQ81_11645 [Methanofollis sp.]|nr:hypothetical protein [Methanofollis sp.]